MSREEHARLFEVEVEDEPGRDAAELVWVHVRKVEPDSSGDWLRCEICREHHAVARRSFSKCEDDRESAL